MLKHNFTHLFIVKATLFYCNVIRLCNCTDSDKLVLIVAFETSFN